jgi:hypothetical protein
MFLNSYVLIICLEKTNTAKRLSNNLSLPKPKLPTHNPVKKNDNPGKTAIITKKV